MLEAQIKDCVLNQFHLLEGLENLSLEEKKRFLEELTHYPASLLHKQRALLSSQQKPCSSQPLPWTQVHHSGSLENKALGEELLSQGKVGCLLLAGGQGSRLGATFPKGMTPVTRVKNKSLFQLFCERTKAASARFGQPLPLYIMTSALNTQITKTYLEENAYFGLEDSQVFLFEQTSLPFLDDTGNWLLEKPGKLATGPSGNGGALKNLYACGMLTSMKNQGVDFLNTIFIDNPLADPFDAELIGLTQRQSAEACLKAIPRLSSHEKMGILIEREGKLNVIEYTELPAQTEAFLYSSTSLFCFSVPWIHSLYEMKNVELPLHLARKIGSSSLPIWKSEQFIFDLLAYCHKAAVLIYPRHEIYAPLKNATGDKSIETVRLQLLEFDRLVMKQLTGRPPLSTDFELDPGFYYPTVQLKEKWAGRILDQSGYIVL